MQKQIKEAGVQRKKREKDLPETEPVTEPVEESAGGNRRNGNSQRKPKRSCNEEESDKETKEKILSLAKRKKIISWNSRLKI